MIRGKGTNAPAAHISCQQSCNDPFGALGRHDARPQAEARVRGDAHDRPLIAIERVSIKGRLLIPEGIVQFME